MENKKRRAPLLKDTTSIILFFLIINIAAVMSPMALMIAPVVIPVLLLYIRAQNGNNAFYLGALAGAAPYFVLGGPEIALAVIIPIAIMTAAIYGIGRFQLSWRLAFPLAALAVFTGILLNGYFSIYILQGSDLGKFSIAIADNIKNQLAGALTATGYEMPMSQQQAIDDLTKVIDPQFVQDLIPTLIISWSMIAAYAALRLARRFLKIGQTKQSHIPWFAMIGINPLLLAAFIVLSIAGSLLVPDQPRLGSLLFNTGYGVSTFLGTAGTLSLIWWSLSVKFRFRRKFTKVFLILITLFYMAGDWMILVAIADSVLDFRNISGKSLWRWLNYQVTQRLTKEDQ